MDRDQYFPPYSYEEIYRGSPGEIIRAVPHLLIFYDKIPDYIKLALHELLRLGKVRVELDYDRVGWSKTGFVYRVKPVER